MRGRSALDGVEALLAAADHDLRTRLGGYMLAQEEVRARRRPRSAMSPSPRLARTHPEVRRCLLHGHCGPPRTRAGICPEPVRRL